MKCVLRTITSESCATCAFALSSSSWRSWRTIMPANRASATVSPRARLKATLNLRVLNMLPLTGRAPTPPPGTSTRIVAGRGASALDPRHCGGGLRPRDAPDSGRAGPILVPSPRRRPAARAIAYIAQPDARQIGDADHSQASTPVAM